MAIVRKMLQLPILTAGDCLLFLFLSIVQRASCYLGTSILLIESLYHLIESISIRAFSAGHESWSFRAGSYAACIPPGSNVSHTDHSAALASNSGHRY